MLTCVRRHSVITDNIFLKLNETSSNNMNGDAMTEDIPLVEEPPALKNGRKDTPFGNGSKIENFIPPINSSSFRNLELEDELLLDEMTLRVTDDEESPDNAHNISKNGYVSEDIAKNSSSLKRALNKNNGISLEVKKQKINGLVDKALTMKKPNEYVSLDQLKAFMSDKKIEKMSRADLEEFCLQKMCENIKDESTIEELNQQVKRQADMLTTWEQEYSSLAVQIGRLQYVSRTMQENIRSKVKEGGNLQDVCPVKLTRTCGVNVNMSSKSARFNPNTESPKRQGVKRKMQRSSLSNKLPSTPQPIPKSTPAVDKSPLVFPKTPQPATTTGINTTLPKVLSSSEVKETTSTNNNSLLDTPLQNNKQNTLTPPLPVARKPATESDTVIDLTDADDSNTTSIINGPMLTPTPKGNIMVMAPHQLNTSGTNGVSAPIVTSIMPTLTYLVQAQRQPGQPLLLITNAGTSIPPNIRPALMFKQVAQGQTQSDPQRLNIVRPGTVPRTTTQPIRSAPTIVAPATLNRNHVMSTSSAPQRHPTSLPPISNDQMVQPKWKPIPPKPSLVITRVGDDIILSWNINKDMSMYEDIASYQLYAFQETNTEPSTNFWQKVVDVKALALPMTCTMRKYTDGNMYHIAVRAVDVKSRFGPFSQLKPIP